jgi:hypothetical protein
LKQYSLDISLETKVQLLYLKQYYCRMQYYLYTIVRQLVKAVLQVIQLLQYYYKRNVCNTAAVQLQCRDSIIL